MDSVKQGIQTFSCPTRICKEITTYFRVNYPLLIFRKQSKVFTPDKEKKENAASTIQQSWRRKQAISKQEKRQRETEDAIINIQSVLRGHLARKKILPPQATSQVSIPLAVRSVEEDKNDDSEGSDSSEAIEIIQSAMKGYLTRQMALQDLKR